MAHYDDVIMPLTLAFGSSTTPMTSTQQVFTGAGTRKVNRLWDQKLRRLRLAHVKGLRDIYRILKVWEALQGPEHSGLVRDWHDWNTSDGFFDAIPAAGLDKVSAFDQPLRNTATGLFVGDGATTAFQMVKRYTVGATAVSTRTISKPQQGTIQVAVDGAAQSEGPDFTVNYGSGVVTFAAAPGFGQSPTGVPVTWGGAFYVPFHFADDEALLQTLRSGRTSGLDVELREARL